MPTSNTCDHGVNPKYCKACESARKSKQSSDTLTPTQIENWRQVLFQTLGPYALFMPVSQILAYKDRMQQEIDALTEEAIEAELELSK